MMENHLITPIVILNRVKKGELSKSEAAETLISLLEGSDNAQIHIACIQALEQLTYKSEKIFKILENLLISDKNPSIRAVAAKTLIKNFFKEGISSIVWAIEYEESPLVLKIIYDFFNILLDKKNFSFTEKLNKWMAKFASNIGVVPEEAKFFLDLEALFANGVENYKINTETYKFFQKIIDYKTNNAWLVVNNQHVECLSYNYFSWKYLNCHQEQIESIMSLANPHLFLSAIQVHYFGDNNVEKVPNSLSLLTKLKKLKLNGNHLTEFPSSIKFLKSLEELDLTRNKIRIIPEWISTLNSLKILNLNHNKIIQIPDIIKDMKSLNELKI